MRKTHRTVTLAVSIEAGTHQLAKSRAKKLAGFLQDCLQSDYKFMEDVAGLTPPDFGVGELHAEVGAPEVTFVQGISRGMPTHLKVIKPGEKVDLIAAQFLAKFNNPAEDDVYIYVIRGEHVEQIHCGPFEPEETEDA